MDGITDTSATLRQKYNFWKIYYRENTGKAIVPIFYYTFSLGYCFPTECDVSCKVSVSANLVYNGATMSLI